MSTTPAQKQGKSSSHCFQITIALIGATATIVAAIVSAILARPTDLPTTTTQPPSIIISDPSKATTSQNPPTENQSPPTPTLNNSSIESTPAQSSSSSLPFATELGVISTFRSFCTRLAIGTPENAYELTSNDYQSQHEIAQFISQFNNTECGDEDGYLTASGNSVIMPCTINKTDPTNGTTSSTRYTLTLIEDSRGRWVIDSIE